MTGDFQNSCSFNRLLIRNDNQFVIERQIFVEYMKKTTVFEVTSKTVVFLSVNFFYKIFGCF